MSMTDQPNTARRLVACKHFRLMPGMRDSERWLRCVAVFDDGSSLWAADETTRYMRPGADVTPDPADPATLGCIEHSLLPEAWGEDYVIQVTTLGDRAVVQVMGRDDLSNGHLGANGPTAEALVAALEAAP